jgi:hypothetical protein
MAWYVRKHRDRLFYFRKIGCVDINCMQLAHIEISDRFLSAAMNPLVSEETELAAEYHLIRRDSVMRKLLSIMRGVGEANNWENKGMQIHIMTFC